ncbi:MAG: hypothetical protein JWM88_2273 [Verrucomicrobia bacterium]|nr:hypothetical protein [Verrucomicrobiota bacterium]
MSQRRNVVIAVLATAVVVMAGIMSRQQGQIARLQAEAALRSISRLPVMGLRTGTERQISFAPLRPAVEVREDHSGETDGPDLGFAGSGRINRPAPPRRRTLAQLVDNPDFVSALGVYQQSILDSRFAGLFRKLNLNESELASFKKLLAQKETAEFDVVAVGQTISENPLSPQELQATVQTVQAGVESEIRSTLGSDRYAVYRDYAETLPQRATIAQLEQRLSYTRAPLTPAQSESMIRILAASSPSAGTTLVMPTALVASADSSDTLPVMRRSMVAAVVTDAAVANAQSVLSHEQVNALAEIQHEQLSTIRASQLLRAAYPGDNLPPLDWKTLLQ